MINYEFLLTKKKKQIGEQKIWQKVSGKQNLFELNNVCLVDNYWIDKPSKVIDRNGLVYTVTFQGEEYRFRLKKKEDIFSSGE